MSNNQEFTEMNEFRAQIYRMLGSLYFKEWLVNQIGTSDQQTPVPMIN